MSLPTYHCAAFSPFHCRSTDAPAIKNSFRPLVYEMVWVLQYICKVYPKRIQSPLRRPYQPRQLRWIPLRGENRRQ